LIGYIFGVFSIALIVISPLMGFVIQRLGRRWPIIIGCLMIGLSFEIFAVISYIESVKWFIVCSFLLRLIQGIGTVFIQVTLLSVAVTCYPNHRAKLIGLFESAIAAGMMSGPLLGTLLFTIGGY